MKFWNPLAALLSLCISASAMAQNLTLSFGTQLPETHVVYKGILEIKRKLEESSKGTMTLKIFPGAQLGDFKAMVGQTQAGDLCGFQLRASQEGRQRPVWPAHGHQVPRERRAPDGRLV